ncbi:MAG: TonB-dependent receptor [Bryobacteraceae bacterium]|nr:TonB-dependent receptor [Bryobacteraceae bacterium]
MADLIITILLKYRSYAHPALFWATILTALPGMAGAAKLSGVVRDPSNAAVPGASVSAYHLRTGVESTVRSGAEGVYVFPDLPPGSYRIRVAAAGFQAAVREPVKLASNLEVRLDLVLSIPQTRTSVEINEALGREDRQAVARVRDSDLTAALADAEGYSVLGGGGVSALPALRGLADDRVNILLNGMSIGQACGNHMNPPLSYSTPAAVEAPLVIAGVTPVRLGGDSTAGTIAVDNAAPGFLAPGRRISTHGGISMFHRTNGVINGGSAWFSLAAQNASLSYAGSYVDADNYKDGAGRMVMSTFHESQNHELHLAARRGANQFHAGAGYQRIPQQGFANARMDMTRNEAKYLNGGYSRLLASGRFDARLYYQFTRHGMNILRDKIPGMNMPMETRGVNMGYTLSFEKTAGTGHTLRAGHETRRFSLDDWWPPVMNMVGSMGPDTLWNVRDGRRTRVAFYGEWEARQTNAWTTLLGVRSETVGMNTGDVVGYNTSLATTGSAVYAADAAEFNAVSRARRDLNFDVTASVRYQPRAGNLFEFGFARKTRSPGIYERYLWVKRSMMSISMNGWFGDGNGYTGNLQLRPEAAHHFTAAAEWRGSGERAWKLRLAPFYTHFNDFIDAGRCAILMDRSNGCTAMSFNAVSGFTSLQFRNYGARLAGVDGSWRLPLTAASQGVGPLTLAGAFSYVRGENTDTGQYLYNIMPLNARTWIEHRRGAWSSAIEFVAVDAKRNIQAVRNELPTPGYALLHVRTSYRWQLADTSSIRLDAGIDNLANRFYAMPLGGRYWVGDKTGNTQVPGAGRNVFAGLSFEF